MGKKKSNRAQVFNPRTKRWVKIDTEKGGIVSHKKSKGPYKGIRQLRPKKKKPEKGPTLEQLRRYHERKRGKHAVKVDKTRQAKETFSRKNPKGVRKWRKAPQRYDIVGVDTKVKQAKRKSARAVDEGKRRVKEAKTRFRKRKAEIRRQKLPKTVKKGKVQAAKKDYKASVKAASRTVKQRIKKAFEPVKKLVFKKPWSRERKKRARYVARTTGASVLEADALIKRAASRGQDYDTMDWDAVQGRDLIYSERVDKMDAMIGETSVPSRELQDIRALEEKYLWEYESWVKKQEV
jgi:hypothetical protein